MDNDPEAVRFAFEQERFHADQELRKAELDLKRQEIALRDAEQRKSGWRNPLALGVLVAVLGLVGNAVVAGVNGYFQRNLAELQAEAGRILEVVKTGDPDTAAANLDFLLAAGLIRDEGGEIGRYLANRDSGTGVALPSPLPGGITGPDSARPVAPEDSVFAMARAVGALRIGQEMFCTAFLVGVDLILTASHCVGSGIGGRAASDWTFQPSTGAAEPAQPLKVVMPPVEQQPLTGSATGVNAGYALLRVEGTPGSALGWLTLASTAPAIGEKLAVVLLRGGIRTVLLSSDEDCAVTGVDEAELEHRCDTGPGSSGSPVVSSAGRIVGIHYRTGGALRADAVLAASPTLREQPPH